MPGLLYEAELPAGSARRHNSTEESRDDQLQAGQGPVARDSSLEEVEEGASGEQRQRRQQQQQGVEGVVRCGGRKRVKCFSAVA